MPYGTVTASVDWEIEFSNINQSPGDLSELVIGCNFELGDGNLSIGLVNSESGDVGEKLDALIEKLKKIGWYYQETDFHERRSFVQFELKGRVGTNEDDLRAVVKAVIHAFGTTRTRIDHVSPYCTIKNESEKLKKEFEGAFPFE